MPRNDVWIVKRPLRPKPGERARFSYGIRWICPLTGKMRWTGCGHDHKLAKTLAHQKREELRRGLVNDPIDIAWKDFQAELVRQARDQKSAATAAMEDCSLSLFKAICDPRGPLVVDFAMIQRFISARLKGSRRCPAKSCGFANPVDRSVCWKCGKNLAVGDQYRFRAVTPTTVNKNLRALRAIFATAVKQYRLPNNPFDQVQELGTAEKPIRALNLDEQKRVLAACPDLRWRTFCYLGFTTGMRRRELVNLRWEDVDLESRRLQVVRTKTGKVRYVRLTADAVEMLRQLRLTHAFPIVFPGDHGADFYWQVGKGLDRIVAIAGVPRFTFHDTRKTCATELARGGVNQKVASTMLGHASTATTARYYQAVDDEMADDALASIPLVQETQRSTTAAQEGQAGVSGA